MPPKTRSVRPLSKDGGKCPIPPSPRNFITSTAAFPRLVSALSTLKRGRENSSKDSVTDLIKTPLAKPCGPSGAAANNDRAPSRTVVTVLEDWKLMTPSPNLMYKPRRRSVLRQGVEPWSMGVAHSRSPSLLRPRISGEREDQIVQTSPQATVTKEAGESGVSQSLGQRWKKSSFRSRGKSSRSGRQYSVSSGDIMNRAAVGAWEFEPTSEEWGKTNSLWRC